MTQLTNPALSLRDRLFAAAEAWCGATGRSLGALSSLVSRDGKTLPGLRDESRKVEDRTLENYARFLADAGNWPGGSVADEAVQFAHVCGVSLQHGAEATGLIGPASGRGAERDAA